MSKKFQNAFSRQEQNSMKRKKDYMKYAQSLECTLQLLESQLHDSDDTSEVIRNVLKTACSFYQGDWAGFLQIDLELGLWTPYVWYHATTSDQTEALLHECESAEFFTRWMDAMHNNDAICFSSIDELENPSNKELEMYRKLNIKGVIAVPVKPRPTGFLVIRNPQRYVHRSSMLQLGLRVLVWCGNLTITHETLFLIPFYSFVQYVL